MPVNEWDIDFSVIGGTDTYYIYFYKMYYNVYKIEIFFLEYIEGTIAQAY